MAIINTSLVSLPLDAKLKKTLKQLVLDGLVVALNMGNGLAYTISSDGEEYCAELDSNYSREYREYARCVMESVNGKSERELISYITEVSAKYILKGVRN